MLDENAVILLVEDDKVDIMTVKRALQKNNVTNPIHIARTGVEALSMLRGVGYPKIEPNPSLILLDLNLPKMGGIEFLKELRSDPDLQTIISTIYIRFCIRKIV